MSTVAEIEAALPKLTAPEIAQIERALHNHYRQRGAASSMHHGHEQVSLEIKGGVVKLSSDHRTAPTTAAILGREIKEGEEIVYLDRRIHRPHQTDYHGTWRLQGALVTELHRTLNNATS